MRILIYSDVHLEFSKFDVPNSGYDVVVLAGDIHLNDKGAQWAKRKFPHVPVIYICGNHEFYHGDVSSVHQAIYEETENSNINFCENRTVTIDGVRFVCATLWTDFQITGEGLLAKQLAKYSMNDYRLIHNGDRTLSPDDTERFHFDSRRFIESEINAQCSPDMRTVVVTHHAPSHNSLRYERVDPRYAPFYASSLDEMVIKSGAKLWIHGHTHESADYRLGETRVVSNPRGYAMIDNHHGNPNFKAECIISV